MIDILNDSKKRVDDFLETFLSKEPNETSLMQAMRYMALNGGKRFRAALVYATGNDLNGNVKVLDYVAGSIELCHSFSLVHDDLPAIDNADLRRGKPSCHTVFGESCAILTGDALFSESFRALASLESLLPAETIVSLFKTLVSATFQLVQGEMLDIEMDGKIMPLKEIEKMEQKKTAALIQAAVLMGAYASNCNDPVILKHLEAYSMSIGLIFQIVDDLLDINSSPEVLGKPSHKDTELNKTNIALRLGEAKARELIDKLYQESLSHLHKTKISFKGLEKLLSFSLDRKA